MFLWNNLSRPDNKYEAWEQAIFYDKFIDFQKVSWDLSVSETAEVTDNYRGHVKDKFDQWFFDEKWFRELSEYLLGILEWKIQEVKSQFPVDDNTFLEGSESKILWIQSALSKIEWWYLIPRVLKRWKELDHLIVLTHANKEDGAAEETKETYIKLSCSWSLDEKITTIYDALKQVEQWSKFMWWNIKTHLTVTDDY